MSKIITYPYFFLGFSFDIGSIDPDNLYSMLENMSLFKRFSLEEINTPVSEDVVRSIQVMCGQAKEINPDEPMSTCEYNPIKLVDFLACDGKVVDGADLKDTNNLKVYLNGQVAELGEDYELDSINQKINILWDDIEDTDLFSFSIPMKIKTFRSV
jgi:hypothetical protein